jgi:hypothetical protein
MTKIDEAFLARLEGIAESSIENHKPSELFRAMGPTVIADAEDVLAWVKHTRHLKDTALDLLADKQKIQKQMKETQFLSTLWIQSLTNHIPVAARPLALKDAAKLIVEGMKKEGIKEYKDEHTAQLEN